MRFLFVGHGLYPPERFLLKGRTARSSCPGNAKLSRLKGEYRAQFFMKGTHRGPMRQALVAALAARPDIKRRTIVDVDPMSVL